MIPTITLSYNCEDCGAFGFSVGGIEAHLVNEHGCEIGLVPLVLGSIR